MTHSSNVDSLAFQFAATAAVMLLTYGFTRLLTSFFGDTTASLLWGFTFFFGLLMAILAGWVARLFGVSFMINKGVQKRITGWAVDFLIVATIMAIQPTIVMQYLLPILVIGLGAGVATTFVLVYFGRRLSAWNLERMVLNYGTCTGTLSSGLLLLRMTDPGFSSPVAIEAGFIAVFSLPFVLASMLLANATFLFGLSIPQIALGFVIILAVSLLVIKLMGQWGKRRV
jgi:ESS family glutamate:Na+ symporter